MFGRVATGERATSAIGLNQGILKTGYLTKQAKSGGANWKTRYFVLNGSALTYYTDHKHIKNAKGDILLTIDTVVEDFSEPDIIYGFQVLTPFMTLRLSASSHIERQEWKTAILHAINEMSNSTRGYLSKKGNFLEQTWVKKFFILHDDVLTYHEDHMRTSKIQGVIVLDSNTPLERRQNSIFYIVSKNKEIILKADNPEDFEMWTNAIEGKIKALAPKIPVIDKTNLSIPSLKEFAIRDGYLAARTIKGDKWIPNYFVLANEKLYWFEDEFSIVPIDIFSLTPNCSVFETNLLPNAFELVTSRQVFHIQGQNASDTLAWVNSLRKVISQAKPEVGDPLLIRATEKFQNSSIIPDPEQKNLFYYEVVFQEKKPLGLVLERSADWAIVKLANYEETNVMIGSALVSINNEPVALNLYTETIRKLSGWQPPLKLGFIRAPEKRGWLTKQARGRRRKTLNWKPRFFVLAEGKLKYYVSDKLDSEPKGEIHLMGSAISLVPHSESSQFFCFRVVSGVTQITMQGLTLNDMMDWASTLYHAIAITNGGGYLLDLIRKRQEREIEEEQIRVQLKKDAQEKREKEEKSAKQALEALEAELNAKSENELLQTQAVQTKEKVEITEENQIISQEQPDKQTLQSTELEEESNKKIEELNNNTTQESNNKKIEESTKSVEESNRIEESNKAILDFQSYDQVKAEQEYLQAQEELEREQIEAEKNEIEQKNVQEKLEEVLSKQKDESKKKGLLADLRRTSMYLSAKNSNDENSQETNQITNLKSVLAECKNSKNEDNSTTENENTINGENNDDDDDDEEEIVENKEIKEPKVQDEALQILTDEILEKSFAHLDSGSRGYLNPMQFSQLMRVVNGTHNMFQEIKIFQRFDLDGNGSVDLEEFKIGFRALVEELGPTNRIVPALRSYASQTVMAL